MIKIGSLITTSTCIGAYPIPVLVSKPEVNIKYHNDVSLFKSFVNRVKNKIWISKFKTEFKSILYTSLTEKNFMIYFFDKTFQTKK